MQSERDNKMTVPQVFEKIMDGIEYIHNAGYVHQDIKPENFMIDPRTDNVYFIDFGLAHSYLDANRE